MSSCTMCDVNERFMQNREAIALFIHYNADVNPGYVKSHFILNQMTLDEYNAAIESLIEDGIVVYNQDEVTYESRLQL